jgi:MFS family permease
MASRGPGRGGLVLLARLRVIVTCFFALDGFLFANWVVCVPQVKAHVHASPGALGIALLGISAGAVVTMMLTAQLCSRFGSRRIILLFAIVMSLAVMTPAQATSVPALTAALLAFGAGFGGLNVAINSLAVDIIGRARRPIMPSFHAAFSGGGLSGALAGGAIASVSSASLHLTAIGLFGLAVTAALSAPLLRASLPPSGLQAAISDAPSAPAAQPGSDGGAPGRWASRPRRAVAVFGAIAACSAYGEGALADWGALHLHTNLHASIGLAAAGYAAFSAAMVVGRMSGTWLLTRAGRTVVLAGGALIASGGMLIAALVPVLAIAILGFLLVGLGLANLFPAAVAQAGALMGPNGVGAASTIGYCGFLAGPPLIGFLAERTSLPVALTTISVFAAAAAVVAVLARHAADPT